MEIRDRERLAQAHERSVGIYEKRNANRREYQDAVAYVGDGIVFFSSQVRTSGEIETLAQEMLAQCEALSGRNVYVLDPEKVSRLSFV